MRRIALVLLTLALLTGLPTAAGAASTTGLSGRPVDFHQKHVGTENYKKTRITNKTGAAVNLLVSAGLPDDFGFGLMPGETCPVFSPGELLAAGASCDAVVRFTPSEGFIGWKAVGSLEVTATDPVTGTLVTTLSIPVYGEAIP